MSQNQRKHTAKNKDLQLINRWLIEGKVSVPKDYQRNFIWRKDQKQNLIDSIINNYDIPKIYFAKNQDSSLKVTYDIIDGQQRCLSIKSFIDGEFTLSQSFKYHGDTENVDSYAGKKYLELPENLRNEIMNYEITVIECENYSKDDQKELFERLQGGTSLSQAESRRALKDTSMPGVVQKLAEHNLFKINRLLDKKDIWSRFWVEEIIANILLDLHKEGISEVSASNLKKMYFEKDKITIDDKICLEITEIFNYLEKAFKNLQPSMSKVGIRRLSWLIHQSLSQYNIKKFHKELGEAYLDFESDRQVLLERYRDDEPDDENLEDASKYDDYTTYAAKARAFDKSGQAQLDTILKNYIFMKLDNLITIVDNTDFSSNQRNALLRRANYRCQADKKSDWFKEDECLKKINLDNMHADHIEPRAYGGKTMLKNGQALCSKCNIYKSDFLS